MELGLSELEASICLVLQGDPGLTGYAIAKRLGKAVPNVYRGISSLKGKGGIIGDSTRPTEVFSVVPLEEFTSRIMSSLSNKIDAVERAFGDTESIPPESGVYKLSQADQVIEKAVSMINTAEKVLSVFVDSDLLDRLAPYFSAASRRGVKIAVRCYEPAEIEGCDVYLWKRRPEMEIWKGEILCLAMDGSEVLISFLGNRQNKVTIFWIKNLFLSMLFHQGMSSGIIHGRLITGLDEGISAEKLLEEMQNLTEKHFYTISQILLQRYL